MYVDIEGNGLEPTKIHVAVCDGKDVYTADDFKRTIKDADVLYMHNGIGYDVGALEKLWNYKLDKPLIDTLVLSRLARPDRPGGHSLAAWGTTFGYPKVENEQWEVLTDVMVERCKVDVELTKRVHEQCLVELSGTDYTRAYDLEAKVYEITRRQIDHGWLLDQEKCWELLGMLQDRQGKLMDEVHRRFVPIATPAGEVEPRYKANGELSKVGLNWLGDDWTTCGGSFTKVMWPEFNLGSRQQIGRYLKYFGWKPTLFTDNGHPIVDEKVLGEVKGIPEATLISDYLLTGKRIAQIQSWVDAVQEDGRVHGYVNPDGTVTHRMTHSKPNMGQVPSTKVWLGKECRECWIVPEGYKLVGMDASGLELRMLAHYMNDPEYTKEVLEGDIHTANQRAAGLNTRDQAKTFIYAYLYGAGDAKIGSIVGGTKTDGARLKRRFLARTPALKDLKERVELAAQRGFIKGLDGRKVAVRSAHAALNTLLQSAGAIVMKQTLVVLDEYATKWGLDYEIIGQIHDELQCEVAEKDAEKFARLAEAAVVRAGQDLGLRCPLAGEAKIGNNWSETH